MGCNAFNHGPHCDCGWGGDTGAGPSGSTAPVVGLFTIARPVVRMSCTIPNATCPECGASVYFYESPYGGRVFFDELGPPWPKHPCTDNVPVRIAFRRPKEVDRSASLVGSPRWRREGWQPLTQASVKRLGSSVILQAEGLSTYMFGIAEGFRYSEGDPILARRSTKWDGSWEISYLPINSNLLNVTPEWVTAYPITARGVTTETWQQALSGDPNAHNLVGMALSFLRGVKEVDGTWIFPDDTDWPAAELHFLLAAAGGYWAGFHNLGTMFRLGLGVHHDPALSMHYLLQAVARASEEQANQSIAALAEIFELGWGTEEDRAKARSVIDARSHPKGESNHE